MNQTIDKKKTTLKKKLKTKRSTRNLSLGIPGLESSTITEDDIEIFNTVKVNQRREPSPQESNWDDEISLGATSKKLKRQGITTKVRVKRSHYSTIQKSTYDEKQEKIERHMLNLVY